MTKILSSIACNLDTHILMSALPLFEQEKVQAIEWSFDTLFNRTSTPDWFLELLTAFSQENRLIGHGVFFSLFSGKWAPEQQKWLTHLQNLSKEFRFDHITEHFGFMTGKNFHQGAPISLPFTKSTLAIGQDRLKRIYNVCECPVGLENLAFAYSLEAVEQHGDFLQQLIEPINGFIILDLHNLYCQLHNFEVDYEDLIQLYPLDKVREIHISGGSWEDSVLFPSKKIRRDTHDDCVPAAVFDLLERTIPKCPNLKFVVSEQLGTGLRTSESQALFREDFYRLDQIVEKYNRKQSPLPPHSFLPARTFELGTPLEDAALYTQQMELSDIVETAKDYISARDLLSKSSLAQSDWQVESWSPVMLDTVVQIAQKWKAGFS